MSRLPVVIRSIVATAVVAAATWGCAHSADSRTAERQACVPGASAACVCTDGAAGAQVCDADGRAFAPCTCAARADADDADPGDDEVTSAHALEALDALRGQACACRDGACADAVEADFEAFLNRYAGISGDQPDIDRAGQLAGELMTCLNRARGGAMVTSTGLAGCDEYVALMETYLRCDKVPQAARDAARQGLDAMESAWGDMSGVPDDVQRQANDACLQAVDAMKQGMAATGCPL
ncbi:MAG: hypothetical protein H6708_02215 [Kofleriaceae bacterium]|nr:hypothetical protein [Kofleriaceae bacterium]